MSRPENSYAELKDPKTFLGFDRGTLAYKSDVSEKEWDFFKHILQGKPSGTKFRAYSVSTSDPDKKEYVIATDSKTGEIFSVTHSAIVLREKIYVMAGRGHSISGKFGKVKVVVDEQGNLWAIKLIHHREEKIFQESVKLEIELGKTLSFSCDMGEKQLAQNALKKKQRILLMSYYSIDFFDFIDAWLSHHRSPERLNAPSLLAFEYEILLILFEICVQLFYLHKRLNVVHTDIKFENILLKFIDDYPGKSKVIARLGDFGNCKRINPDAGFYDECRVHQKQFENAGIKMIAPEVCKTGARYSFSVDVYAIGALITFFLSIMDCRRMRLGKSESMSQAVVESRTLFFQVAKLMCDADAAKRPSLSKATHEIYRYLSSSAFEGLRDLSLFSHYVESIKPTLERESLVAHTLPHAFDISHLHRK